MGVCVALKLNYHSLGTRLYLSSIYYVGWVTLCLVISLAFSAHLPVIYCFLYCPTAHLSYKATFYQVHVVHSRLYKGSSWVSNALFKNTSACVRPCNCRGLSSIVYLGKCRRLVNLLKKLKGKIMKNGATVV